jgi:membrane dipeptidase
MRHAILIAAALYAGAASAEPLPDPVLEARARAVHERVVALDTHVDIPLDYASAAMDPGGFTSAQVDLPKMRAGGLDAAFFIVYTPQGRLDDAGYAEARRIAMTRLQAIHRMVNAYPDEIALSPRARDVAKIVKSGRKAALIGVENAFPLGPAPQQDDIDRLYTDGVRYAGITHFGHNQFGDSSNPDVEGGDPDERWGGLSPAGRDLVAMLNRAGIMVDVSHAGRKTMLQTIEASKAPIIASHSGVKAVADSPRNLDDEQLRVLAANGGVAQMVALDAYVKVYTPDQIAFRDQLRKEMGLETAEQRRAASKETTAEYEKRLKAIFDIAPRASVADFVNHIDHAVKVAGVDHVGIASDFDGGGGIVGWENASETLNVTRELVRRGYSDDAIAKIWGGNLLRVLCAVEETAERLKKVQN